ncbi:hypothetical protein C355_06225 [Cryptococcus neoformans Th84]|nr:hypothetical protein C355_06225 [Cryptococcus neoformans var. grubii Th84]
MHCKHIISIHASVLFGSIFSRSHPYILPSIHFIHPPIHPSIHLSIHPSIHLSIYHPYRVTTNGRGYRRKRCAAPDAREEFQRRFLHHGRSI